MLRRFLLQRLPGRARAMVDRGGVSARGADRPASTGRGAAIDRALFREELRLLALKVPARKVSDVSRRLRRERWLLNKPKIKPVVPVAGATERLVLLSEAVSEGAADGGDLPSTSAPDGDVSDRLPRGLQELIEGEGLGLEWHTKVLDYSHWSVDHILRRLLPDGIDVPSSFETVGHIAHLNLRDEQLPHKYVIGQVLLDKCAPRIRTIVNKKDKIENAFRVLPLEVIAGDEDMETMVLQHGIRFSLNFAEVYWNSRLEAEHARLVDTLAPGTVIADMTAGVGPFAVPSALKGCTVFANDLNPRCVHYLNQNLLRNKVPVGKVAVSCMDARAFVRALLGAPTPAEAEAGAKDGGGGGEREGEGEGAGGAPAPKGEKEGPLPGQGTDSGDAGGPAQGVLFDCAIINLPATGLEFVDVFRGAFAHDEARWRARSLPLVHCYTFVHSSQADHSAVARAEVLLGAKLPDATTREVRDVAPNKRMVRLTFRVPEEAAFARDAATAKRMKLS